MRNLYEILGVAKDATGDEIQARYRSLAKELHPDRNPGNKKAEEQIKEVNAAYHILKDADRRAKYDELSRSTGRFQQGQPEGTRTYSQPQQPRDLNEWMDQMFRQTYGMSWEEMVGGKPNSTVFQTTSKKDKDEETRRREAELTRIQADTERKREVQRKEQENEIARETEFERRVSAAFTERIKNLSFRERLARATTPSWDFTEQFKIEQQMKKEEAQRRSSIETTSKTADKIINEASQDPGGPEINIRRRRIEISRPDSTGVPEMKPMTVGKPGHRPSGENKG